ncbi:MAG: T9SS type A sorting domain-containing protein [Bacteroidales bacterium]|nr:T9SS type A sorting domain-containing protein [Bacteroidales bacterium]
MKFFLSIFFLLVSLSLYPQKQGFQYPYKTLYDEFFISFVEKNSIIHIFGYQSNLADNSKVKSFVHLLDTNGLLIDTFSLTSFSEKIVLSEFFFEKSHWTAFGTKNNDSCFCNITIRFDTLFNRISTKVLFCDTNVLYRNVQDVIKNDSSYYIVNYELRSTSFPFFSILKISDKMDSLKYFSSFPYTGIVYKGLRNKLNQDFRVFTFVYYIPTWGQAVYFDDDLNIKQIDSLPHILHQFNDAIWVSDSSFAVTGITMHADSLYYPNVYDDDMAIYIIDTNNHVQDYYFNHRYGTAESPGFGKNLILLDGYFYYSGAINRIGPPFSDTSYVILIKLDSNLNPVWKKTLGDGIKNMDISGIYPLSDGSILLLLWEYENHSDFTRDAIAIKMSPDGEIVFITPLYTSQKKQIKIFPNPASDQLHISLTASAETIEVVQLLDLQGKVVMQKELNTAATQLDIRNLPSGAYLIRGYTKTGKSFSGKVVKE